jgi:hypothetical protein
MALDPKDARLADPKFQEFEDLVGHVLDKRDAKRKEEEALKLAEDAKKPKKLFDFLPW